MTLTDYSQVIIRMFDMLAFEPRQYQINIINQILNQFIDNDVRDVVINAPTGSGKSVIGIVTSMCMDYINSTTKLKGNPDGKSVSGAYLLAHVNALVEQYKSSLVNHPSWLVVLGAKNYDCLNHNDTADVCTFNEDSKNKMISPECGDCKYLSTSINKHKVKLIVTNYSYYLSAIKKTMLMCVYDECHTLDNAYVSHNETVIDKWYINHHFHKSGNPARANVITSLLEDLRDVEVGEHIEFLNRIRNLLKKDILEIDDTIRELLHDKKYSATVAKKLSLLKRKRKHKLNEYNKLGNFLTDDLEHVVDKIPECERLETENTLKLTPIFVRNEIDEINSNTCYRLYMSATNPKIYYDVKLRLKKFVYIKMDPVFPISSKQIGLINIAKLNMRSLQDTDIQNAIISSCDQIMVKHTNEKGVIHVPSFNIGDMIWDELRKYHKIYYQQRGEKLKDVLQQYIEDPEPCILMTPSGWEGIDLKDDLGKWQIIVKAPYAVLGDKRIKYISQTYSDIYQIDTIVKIIQAAGRCTRSMTDSSITYCLDSNITNCFNDAKNIWRNEFEVVDCAWLNRTWE